MSKRIVHVGGTLADTKRRVLDAVERAKAGQKVREDHIVFASWAALASVMTAKRFELLQHLHRNPETSVAALARNLKRDYKRVHADVATLVHAGLIERDDGALRAQYGEIRAQIAL